RPRSCLAVHSITDPLIGEPICPDCFDYQAAIIWNANAGELWRRSTIALRRALAGLSGVPATQLRDHVRLSFSKVVEYQRRGSVHIHAVIRLDAAGDSTLPPVAPFDAGLLSAALL